MENDAHVVAAVHYDVCDWVAAYLVSLRGLFGEKVFLYAQLALGEPYILWKAESNDISSYGDTKAGQRGFFLNYFSRIVFDNIR